ncbi:MAG: nuclear transport factor 2 family protein [Enhydrobacter sp.]|nr:nuclear transport factor 2 family protein [Enhydrobacter sp.]
MTNRAHMEQTVRSLYAARVRGDLDGTVRDLAEEAVFSLNGRGTGIAAMSEDCCGRPAVRESVRQLIENWRFDDWEETAFLIDGDRVALQWAARVTFVPTGKSATMQAVDMIAFRDGKIVEFRQSTDTAMLMSLAS